MTEAPWERTPRRVLPGLIALVTTAAFLPALTASFLTWDDLDKLRDNLDYRGLGWTQLRWMWTTGYTGLYQPVAWMTWGADYLLWGMRPAGYHLTSLLLHVVTGLVVYGLARRLLEAVGSGDGADDPGARDAGAALAALFFAVHPLRAEPVAWVSARGDVLAGLFLVSSTLAYVEACRRGNGTRARPGWLAGAVGLFALSLLSKPTGVMLPLALLVLDLYPLRRLGGGPGRWLGPGVRHVWWEKLPFVAAGLVIGWTAVLVKARTASMLPRAGFEPLVGVSQALFGAAFYLRKTFLLGPVSPLYERPPQVDPWTWPFLLSGAAVLVITALLVRGRRWWPGGLTAWVCYLLILAPASGLVPYGSQLVAARYSYASCVPWAIVVGGGVPALARARRRGRVGSPVAIAAAAVGLAAVAGLGVLTWQQAEVWRDSETLWRYTLSVNPRSAVAHIELGLVDERKGDFAGAADHFRRALEIWPGSALDHVAIGLMFERERNFAAAAVHFRQAVSLWPRRAVAHVALGRTLVRQGELREAIDHYRAALELQPDLVEARTGLELAQGQLGAGKGGGAAGSDSGIP